MKQRGITIVRSMNLFYLIPFIILLVAAATWLAGLPVAHAAKKPNILVIWGDDIGQSNISAYTMG
ncbi:MAG: hypothetical protein ACWGP1_17955, partial [Syntrophobacteria bacterium]